MRGRRILLGVTGGIAAYKAAELCRLLVKAGADEGRLRVEEIGDDSTPSSNTAAG